MLLRSPPKSSTSVKHASIRKNQTAEKEKTIQATKNENFQILSQPTPPRKRSRCSPNTQPNIEENIIKTDPISVLIRKTNGEPFKQEEILNLRKLIFSAAKANFDVCLLRSGMAEIYFQNENLANILI